jgi:hypothetical protein
MAVSKNARERLSVMPDRLCVGHCIFHAQAKETHKGKSVMDLKLHLAVGKVMEASQDKDHEHGHKAEGLCPAGLCTPRRCRSLILACIKVGTDFSQSITVFSATSRSPFAERRSRRVCKSNDPG